MFEAFFILPNHMSHAVGTRSAPGRLGRAVERGLTWLTETFAGHLADWAVRRRYLTVGLSLFLLISSVALLAGGFVKFQAFPELEGDVVEARILLPQGTPLSRTELITDRLLHALNKVNTELSTRETEGVKLVRHVSVQYGKNEDSHERGAHVATITVDLLGSETRHSRTDEILERWRGETGVVPDVIDIKYSTLEIGLAGRPIEIRLGGLPLTGLKQASQDLQTWLRDYDGALDIGDDLRPGKPEIRVRMRDGALALGLDARALSDQLATALLGRVASEIQIGPESLEVDVRLAAADRDSLAGLETLLIKLPNGREVPLITIATLEAGRGWARINRIDGRPTVTVTGDIDLSRANANELIRHTTRNFLPGLTARYPGLVYSVEGEQASGAEAQASIARAFLIGLIGVFLLLCFQFRSYALPPVMMLIIPMALIGVVLGHLLMGFDISMPSMVGFVSLAGIVVNNAILMVQFVNQALARNMAIEDAARAAARRRFRPMFLTSLTTVLGLLPLLSETSLQAQILQPLVVSLVFGLLATTVLVIALVPALLSIMHDLGLVEPPETADETLEPAIAQT
jgi:multidrug efflux pump subunit AcrB